MLSILRKLENLFDKKHEGGYISDVAILEPSEVEFPLESIIKESEFSDKQKDQIRKIIREELNNIYR